MCRSIKRLRDTGCRAGDAAVREAALQFVRKISGYRSPSRANQAAFDGAVDEVTAASRRLLDSLIEGGGALSRGVGAARSKTRKVASTRR